MTTAEVADGAVRTLWGDAWRRLRKNRLAISGLGWIVIVLLMALTADLWVPGMFADPLKIDTTPGASLQPPSLEHPFGTDKLGRDVFARVVYGARVSLMVGIIAVSISLMIGVLLGRVWLFWRACRYACHALG